MQNILIVDDEKPFLTSLKDGLREHADSFQVFTAEHGGEAVSILQNQPIDLLVTDLKMPVMDGFELLGYMSRHHPELPIIVMTAFGTQEIEDRLKKAGNYHYVEKPLDIDNLAVAIYKALGDASRSFIRGINLATFLQLVQLENKTCTLKIKSKSGRGVLHIKKGELYAAQTETASGEKAVCEIVCWDDPEIDMEPICRCKEREIEASIEYILLEAFRMEDERRDALTNDTTLEPQDLKRSTPQAAGLHDDAQPAAGRPEIRPAVQTRPASGIQTKLSDYLQKLSAVKAYALFDERDHLLVSAPKTADFGELAPSLYLQAAQSAGEALGQTLRFMELKPDQGLRRVLFKINRLQVCVTLAGGARIDQFMARFAAAQKG
ncbi:response regulator [Desulfosarcina sp.]|uniref:response regulator n=1 Tax=Desulfosarcina sp. TaxID=2027861 RepID=UPI003970E151